MRRITLGKSRAGEWEATLTLVSHYSQAVNRPREREPPSPKDRRDGWAAASMPRDNQVLTHLLNHHHRLRKPSSRLKKKQNKTEESISSRIALRKPLLAQQDPFCACPWSLHVPSHHFSGLLHITYRPQGQLVKHRTPAESERETSSRNSLVT